MENADNVALFTEEVNDWLENVLNVGGDGAGIDPRATGAGIATPLPCLYIHNVTETDGKPSQKLADLSARWKGKSALPVADRKRQCGYISPREKKAANMLFLNAADLLQRGVERCAFVTITTPQNMSYWEKEGWQKARGLFRSWISHSGGFPFVFGAGRDWCRIIEPQRRGAIHWHMLVDLGVGVDIRSGVDFEAFKRRDYRTASPVLRSIWARMRQSGRAYGLGRVEVMPVYKEKWEACARYVGKYLSKAIHREVWENHCDNKAKPLHARRVGFSQGWRVATSTYSWVEDGAEWRKGVSLLAAACGAKDLEGLKGILGKRWAWTNKDFIQNAASYDLEGVNHISESCKKTS